MVVKKLKLLAWDNLNRSAHIEHMGNEAGFFVGADGAGVAIVHVEAKFGDPARLGPLAETFDDEGVDAFAAVGGVDVHEAQIGVGGVAEIGFGGLDAGVTGTYQPGFRRVYGGPGGEFGDE